MSKILDAVIETAHDLHDAEVMDEITMHEFEAFKLGHWHKIAKSHLSKLKNLSYKKS